MVGRRFPSAHIANARVTAAGAAAAAAATVAVLVAATVASTRLRPQLHIHTTTPNEKPGRKDKHEEDEDYQDAIDLTHSNESPRGRTDSGDNSDASVEEEEVDWDKAEFAAQMTDLVHRLNFFYAMPSVHIVAHELDVYASTRKLSVAQSQFVKNYISSDARNLLGAWLKDLGTRVTTHDQSIQRQYTRFARRDWNAWKPYAMKLRPGTVLFALPNNRWSWHIDDAMREARMERSQHGTFEKTIRIVTVLCAIRAVDMNIVDPQRKDTHHTDTDATQCPIILELHAKHMEREPILQFKTQLDATTSHSELTIVVVKHTHLNEPNAKTQWPHTHDKRCSICMARLT